MTATDVSIKMTTENVTTINDQSSKALDENTERNQLDISWDTWVKGLTAIGAVGGLVMHLIGHISHQTYLTAWGIDPGLTENRGLPNYNP